MNRTEQASILLSELVPSILQGIQISIVSQHNLSNLQFILMVIIEQHDTITMSALAKRFQMSLPRTTGLINRLIKQDLLVRTTSPEDRRLVIISLSAKGKQLIQSYKKMIRTRWQQVLEGLSDRDIDQFMSVIKKIKEKVRVS